MPHDLTSLCSCILITSIVAAGSWERCCHQFRGETHSDYGVTRQQSGLGRQVPQDHAKFRDKSCALELPSAAADEDKEHAAGSLSAVTADMPRDHARPANLSGGEGLLRADCYWQTWSAGLAFGRDWSGVPCRRRVAG